MSARRIGLIVGIVMCASSATAMDLTLEIPKCKPPPGRWLPDDVTRAAGRAAAWTKVSGVSAVSGHGLERIDGSGMFESWALFQFDATADGVCDWFVDLGIPISSGGDRMSSNSLYLGTTGGYRAVAPAATRASPVRPRGQASELPFHYGEDVALIRDRDSGVNYVITAFYDRDQSRSGRYGYRILSWDPSSQRLVLLDKWKPESAAKAVYAHFKAHGARLIDADPQAKASFDPEVERQELLDACRSDRPPAPAGETLSPFLSPLCKR